MDFINIMTDGNTFERLMNGLLTTLEIALLSSSFSIIFGFFLGIMMTSPKKTIRLITKLYLEFFRLMPQLVLLFVFYYGVTTTLGLNFDAMTSAIIIFTLWGTAEMGDLVRSALVSVSKYQIEAAQSLGISRLRISILVKIPLAVKNIIPGCVNLITRIIKTTAIVPLIGVIDVTKAAQAIIDYNRFEYPASAIYIYSFVFVLYFICCFPLSKLAAHLQNSD